MCLVHALLYFYQIFTDITHTFPSCSFAIVMVSLEEYDMEQIVTISITI